MDTQLILSTYLSLALDEDNTLQHHDEVEHGGHYDPATMSCKLRDEMEADTLSKVDDGSSNHGNPKPGRDENGRPCGIGGIFTGTTVDYKKSSLEHVGEGEGTQVYGWGLYGSSVRGVGETYAKAQKTDNDGLLFDGHPFSQHIDRYGTSRSSQEKAMQAVLAANGNLDSARDILESNSRDLFGKVIGKGVDALKWFDSNRSRFSKVKAVVYSQTFFTNRAPGDESHLLEWYSRVSDENYKRVLNGLKNRFEHVVIHDGDEEYDDDGNLVAVPTYAEVYVNGFPKYVTNDDCSTGQSMYECIIGLTGSPKGASEFLAESDIDGIKYPVDSYGGKSIKDGNKEGWNYVSFRDDNICVNRKFKDGVEVSLDMSIFQMKGKNRMDNIAFDEDEVKSAATAYLDMVNNGIEKASDPDGGKNPLMELTGKDETDPKIDELDDFFDQFDMHTPLTDKEKEILERGVNDEAIDKMRELVKDAEVAGEVEQMEYLQKMLDSVEKCRAKGLLCGYIKIDKDTGEIVRGSTAPVNDPSKDAPEVPWDEGEYESDTWRSDSEADPEGGDVDASSEQLPEEVQPEEIAPEGNGEQQQTESSQPAPGQTQSPTEAVNPPQPQNETPPQDDQPQEQPQEIPQDQPAPAQVPVDEDENEDDGGATAADSIDAETARRLACWYRY